MNDDMTLCLNLTPAELDKIANALGHRPYIEVAGLLQKIGQQVAEQQQKRAGPLTGPQEALEGGGATSPPATH